MQIFQFLIIPQYVLGGVLVPLRGTASYLNVLAHLMPMRYVVELTRAAFYAGTPGYRQVVSGSPLLDTVVTGTLFVSLMIAGAAGFGYRERPRGAGRAGPGPRAGPAQPWPLLSCSPGRARRRAGSGGRPAARAAASIQPPRTSTRP